MKAKDLLIFNGKRYIIINNVIFINILEGSDVSLDYLNCLVKQKDIITDEGNIVEVFELSNNIADEYFDEWARHFRQQYCNDNIIDSLVNGTGLTRKEFLLKMKFPDKSNDFGPATRSGDFCELLISDYLEYTLKYYVPRERYQVKFNRNSSTQGTDVIALKMIYDIKDDPKDELVTFEVKGQATHGKAKNRLQDAVNDSFKDSVRKGECLSAIKQRFIEKNDIEKAIFIERFQNKPDRPYIEKTGAAAIHESETFSTDLTKTVSTKGEKLWMIVIKRENLMDLIHELYRRAAQC